MTKQILVTGGAGFVGSNLCIYLKNKYSSYEIIALDNLRRRGSELNVRRLTDHNVKFIHGDIRIAEDLSEFEHLDVIIDASADPSVLSGITSPVSSLINTNLSGTVNCLELAVKHKAQFIFLSTSRIYPIKLLESCNFEELPTRFQWTDEQAISGVSSKGISEDFPLQGSRSFYGASKLCSEMLITEYHELKNLETVVNRCGVISGPWQMGKVDQGVIILWLARHFFKKELSYIGYDGKGKQMRDVMHVADLAKLIDHQVHHAEIYNGKTFNVGGGLQSSFSLQELTAYCQNITGNKIKINEIKEARAADIKIYVSDASKIQHISGWQPQETLEGLLKDSFLWIKENEQELKRILA